MQIPVIYAVGRDNLNYALFMDNVYKQRWDFTVFWWEARMFGDQLRFYVMTGPDLPDLRKDYMELVGRPPLPPRKSFGLWVSEFGYDNWNQIETLRSGLRDHGFPVDGFVIDLNWFGGIDLKDASKSKMGRLNWDEQASDGNPYFFPSPGGSRDSGKTQAVQGKAGQVQQMLQQHHSKQWELAVSGAKQALGQYSQSDDIAAAQWAQSRNMTEPELKGRFADARILEAIHKAAKWDALQSGKSASVARPQAAPVVKPGASKGPGAQAQAKCKEVRASLKKSGSLEDAARLFKMRG